MSDPEALTIEVPPGGRTTALVYHAADRTALNGPSQREGSDVPTLILAHGAGAGQRSPFIVAFARAIAALGVDVVTFNFLYTEQRRRMPDRPPVLEACYRAVVEQVSARRPRGGRSSDVFIGGKSMGGRIATQIAAADAQVPVSGVVLLGYPLHPPGRPDQRRDAHLPAVRRPMLFVQGSRDAFGTPAEFDDVVARMSPRPTIEVVNGGDHSFKLAKRDEKAQAAVYDAVQRTIVAWIESVMDTSAP